MSRCSDLGCITVILIVLPVVALVCGIIGAIAAARSPRFLGAILGAGLGLLWLKQLVVQPGYLGHPFQSMVSGNHEPLVLLFGAAVGALTGWWLAASAKSKASAVGLVVVAVIGYGALYYTDDPARWRRPLVRFQAAAGLLDGADLSGVNLSGVNLIGADLSGAYLYGAYLEGAHLRGADLTRADLTHANLRLADLTRADLTDASLHGAILYGVQLREAELVRANLGNAYAGFSHLHRANLLNANLRGADFYYADFSSVRNLTPDQLNQTRGYLGARNLPDGASADARRDPLSDQWQAPGSWVFGSAAQPGTTSAGACATARAIDRQGTRDPCAEGDVSR